MPNQVDRRDFLKAAAAIAATAASGEALAADTSKTLVIASPATPQGLDGDYDVSLGTVDSTGALYDNLIAYKKIPDPASPDVMREDIGVHPDQPYGLALEGKLATKWELSPDGKKVTFTLREGVKSTWGNPLTAEDVKYSWARRFNSKGNGTFMTRMLGIADLDQITVESPQVVSFYLPKPTPLILKLHCNLGSPIYDQVKMKQVSTTDDPWANNFLKNSSAGFGPYRMKDIIRGQQAVFQARDDYYLGKPYFDTVVMREVPSSASRLSLLQGGAVDIAQFLAPREYLSLKTSPMATFDAVAASYGLWLELNAKIPPFDNVKVRQAMNYLLPRDEIIKTVYYDLASKQTACIPQGYPMADYSFFDYDENLDKAKDLLKQAGFANGFKTTISYDAGNPVQEPIALIFQTSLRRVGVEAVLDKLPAGVFYENVSRRQKPIIFYFDSPWTPDPGYSTALYFSSKSFVDYSNYSNPEVDKLIQQGMETLDDSRRKSIYTQVQKIVMDEAPWGFMVYPKYAIGRKKALKGFTYYTSNNLRFQDFTRA
ncbi:ABC transporter substrate-binding protein [Rhodopila sp.]|uniref:ABC transporter substrate-binding protein n=1 Tax=Rhodopila sp. TaxID=2480087 RepID=UPI003D13F266